MDEKRRAELLEAVEGLQRAIEQPPPMSITPITGRWVQRKTIGGWKPSHNTPHQGAKEIERRRKRLAAKE